MFQVSYVLYNVYVTYLHGISLIVKRRSVIIHIFLYKNITVLRGEDGVKIKF